MGKKLTKEEAQNRLDVLRPKVKIISDYNGIQHSITCQCKDCGYIWKTKFHTLIYGVSIGCPKCAIQIRNKNETKKHEEFVEQLKKKKPNIEILGKYTKIKERIEVSCLVCGHVWSPTADNLLHSDANCPLCARDRISEKNRMSHEAFTSRCKQVDVTPLEEYTGLRFRILVRCDRCGLEYQAPPASILAGHGCSACQQSKGERAIRVFLTYYNVDFKTQHTFENCRNILVLPFDFYLPDYNICIEYDGEQHFRPVDFFGGEEAFQKRQKNDLIKTEFCENNGIELIRIPYYMLNKLGDILFNKLNIIEHLIDTSPLGNPFEDDFYFE